MLYWGYFFDYLGCYMGIFEGLVNWGCFIFLIWWFRLLATHFSIRSNRKVSKRVPPQSTSPHKQHEGTFVTPDLCGCCGTHELKSKFAQTSSQKAPHKSLVPLLA